MKQLMTVHTLGPQLIALLGMPKHVTRFELRCAAGEPVTVNCEFYPEGDAAAIGAVLAGYELVPRPTELIGKAGPEAIMPLATRQLAKHPAEIIGFDA